MQKRKCPNNDEKNNKYILRDTETWKVFRMYGEKNNKME
jgi:hypothetical protein